MLETMPCKTDVILKQLWFRGVCVYLLKRSKTCTLPWWSFTWTYFFLDSSFDYYMVNRVRCIFSSVLDEQGSMNTFFSIGWAGGPGPLCQAWSNEARHNGGCNLGRQIVYLRNILIVMVINKCLVDFWFSCFKLLICTYKGTSSFMTSALDALVLVQVCNLWWVSDKVPQGRGVAPVQLLSRITLDYLNRMSNLHF